MRRTLAAGLITGVSAVIAAAILNARSGAGQEYVPQPIAGVDMECSTQRLPVPWSFCIHRVPTSTNRDLLYYLHARNGDATWWNDEDYHTGRLYAAWEAQGQDPPTVASISFGKLWMLSDFDPKLEGGLLRVMTDVVLPTVEAGLSSSPETRMAAGISMGGFNALLLALKSDGLFSKVAAVCPPVQTVSHHDGLWSVLKAQRESRTSYKRALMLWVFSRRFYPTREIWSANDPLSLSRAFPAQAAPSLYLTCGKSDDWGCFKGSELLAANIARAGGNVTWVPREGGHCDIEYASLANFLQSP